MHTIKKKPTNRKHQATQHATSCQLCCLSKMGGVFSIQTTLADSVKLWGLLCLGWSNVSPLWTYELWFSSWRSQSTYQVAWWLGVDGVVLGTWGFSLKIKHPKEDICMYIHDIIWTIAILQKSGQLKFWGKVDVHFVERRAVFQAMLFHVAVGIGILDESIPLLLLALAIKPPSFYQPQKPRSRFLCNKKPEAVEVVLQALQQSFWWLRSKTLDLGERSKQIQDWWTSVSWKVSCFFSTCFFWKREIL